MNPNAKIPDGMSYEDNSYTRLLKKDLNIDVVYDWVASSSDFDEKMNLCIGSGAIPDLMNVNATQYRALLKYDMIQPLDQYFDALREEPLDRWYEVGNVIAIVDANLEEHLSEEAEYILASEVANAGEIILSHADEVSAEQADTTVAHLNRALEQIKCPRRVDKEVLRKSTLDLNEEDFNRLISCGYQMESYRKLDMEEKKGFESVYFMNVKMTEEQLKTTVGKLMNDRECGEVFRVKGFLQKEDGSWIQLNATHNGITMNPIEKGQEVIIVIGEELKEQAIKKYFLKQDNL
jgi:G3E family GTPase